MSFETIYEPHVPTQAEREAMEESFKLHTSPEAIDEFQAAQRERIAGQIELFASQIPEEEF
jgi:hypothetical protein